MRVLATAVVAAVLVGIGFLVANGLPSLNPFADEEVDRSPPAVLRSITKLSEYHAASAQLQQVVDIEQDAKYLPDFIKGERTLFLASGSVDAIVDFSRLGKDAVRLSEDGKSATVTLPAPRLGEPEVDLDQSRVVDRDRGLVDRVGSVFEDSPTSEREVQLAAERKLAAAARADRRLLETARRNTTRMLTGLLTGLGVERVTVRFRPPPV